MELQSQLHSMRSGSRSHNINLRDSPVEFDEIKENSKVYVAVPKEVQEWMENLMYLLKSIDKNLLIVFVHVHQPSKLIQTPLGLMPEKDVSLMFVSKHRNLEKKKMNECLNKYVHTCCQNDFNATTLYVDNDDIAMGLLEIIRQHKVTNLFMGAGSAKNFYFWPNSNAKEPNSTIAKNVRENAEPSCRIHFIRKGEQICSREPFQNDPDANNLPKSSLGSSLDHFMEIRSQSPPPSEAKQTIPSRVNYKSPSVNVVADASFPTGFSNSRFRSGSEDSSSSTSSSHQNFVSDVDSQTSNSLPATPHNKNTSIFQRITEDISARYEEAMPEAEKFNREACEELSRHSKANQDLIQANRRAQNELMKNNELLSSLISQNAQLWKTINELHAKFEETSAFMEKLTQERDIALREAQQLKRHGSSSPLVNCTEFSYSEIRQATKNFSPLHKIGEGGFGAVYRGFLRHARVAIKISNRDSTQGDQQFYQEIKILSLIRHPHLVTLIGACLEARALVYEYHELASLDKHLTYKDRNRPLPWRERVRIALEICSALIFLHSLHVVHGDLKPENVLLDSNFTVKLSDFGICQEVHVTNVTTTPHHITDHPKGTVPYIDPEYLRTGELTPQYDVYSFGVVLLQLVTGKVAMELKKKIEDAMKKHKIEKMVDPSAGWPLEQAKKMIEIGLLCSNEARKRRPDLGKDVWGCLESIANVPSASLRRPLACAAVRFREAG